MKDTKIKETTSGSHLKDRLKIISQSVYAIDGKLSGMRYMVSVEQLDGKSEFEMKLFNDYKEARQHITEKYGI